MSCNEVMGDEGWGTDRNLKFRSIAELPRESVDSAYNPPTGGRTHVVSSGGDIQAAINDAVAGDIISIEAGAEFVGDNITLPFKSGDDWIYIQTSAVANLPTSRVSLADTVFMPRIVQSSSGNPVFSSHYSASKYRFVGLHIQQNVAAPGATNLMIFGYDASYVSPATTVESLPTDITIDRCVLKGGPPSVRTRVGVNFNVVRGAIVDSYLCDLKDTADAQAIIIFNTPGPIKIHNNYLEATGENMLVGGNAPKIPGVVPSDITMTNNYVFKPMYWKFDHPTFTGHEWGIKNLLELKLGKRVLVQGNVFRNNWLRNQAGYAIVLTVRNEDGTAPWSAVEDITFVDNVIIDSERTLMLSGQDEPIRPSETSKRIVVSNNLARSGPEALFTHGRIELSTPGSNGGLPNERFVFTNNTIVTEDYNASSNIALMDSGPQILFTNTDVTWTDNILAYGNYGVIGAGVAVGTASMNAYWNGYTFTGNVLFGSGGGNNAATYPAGNDHPQTVAEIRFMDEASRDYRLAPDSPYLGKGADVEMLRAIEADVIAGVPSP